MYFTLFALPSEPQKELQKELQNMCLPFNADFRRRMLRSSSRNNVRLLYDDQPLQ